MSARLFDVGQIAVPEPCPLYQGKHVGMRFAQPVQRFGDATIEKDDIRPHRGHVRAVHDSRHHRMEKPGKEPVRERSALAPLTRGPDHIGPGPPQLCDHVHDYARLILQVSRDDANQVAAGHADAAAHGDMGAHVARQSDTPDPLIVLCNPADHVWSAITGMIINYDHLPIEILARKCLGHRFVERYEIIRFVEGRNDEADKRPHVRVAPQWQRVPSVRLRF